MKEVKIIPGKKDFYFTIFKLLKEGKNPAKICKLLSISKQNLNYYLRKMKDKNEIERIGYGVWRIKKEVKTIPGDTILLLPVRGHAFIWKFKVPKLNNWDKIRRSVKHKELGTTKIIRIFIKNKKVWLGKKNIIIYDSNSFYGKTALESRKYAIIRMLEIIKIIENKLNISLRPYTFKPKREHYALVKNNLAIQCNREGKKISIIANDGSPWFTIDDSYNLDELETLHPKTALIDNLGIQKYFNSHRNTNYEITPDYIKENFKEMKEMLKESSENQIMLSQVLKQMEGNLTKLTKIVYGKK